MKRKGNRLRITALLLMMAIPVYAGCKKKEEPPVQPAAKPKSVVKPAAPVQKQQSSARTTTAQTFDFKSKKDPFKPFIMPPEPSAPKAAAVKVRSADQLPIQSYEVGKFTVSGIITGLRENKALLVDPAGKGYVVKQGMLIGNGGGHISKISPSSIEVLEQFRDDRGHVRKRKIVLQLAKKK